MIAWDVTGEYLIIYDEEKLRQLLVETKTVQNGEINHKPFYYQMKVGTPLRISWYAYSDGAGGHAESSSCWGRSGAGP